VLMKCPTCGLRISAKWLFIGLPWSKYRCKRCGSVLAGTLVRLVLTSIAVGVAGYVLLGVLKGRMSAAALVPTIALALVLLLGHFPWQVKKVGRSARRPE
jgi:hypothetical protein